MAPPPTRVRRLLAIVSAVLVLATGGLAAAAQQTTAETKPASLAAPVGEQLTWVLDVLNDGAQSLTAAEVTARFSPEFLDAVPAEQVIALIQQVAVAFGPFALEGFTRPPTDTQANALVTGGSGIPLVVPVAVEAARPHRITGLNVAPVPPPPGVQLAAVVNAGGTPVAGPDRLDGLFDVGGGRQVYLSCVGTGSPTVVLEAGLNDLAATWFAVESAVSGFTRVCSYDRANTAGSASDRAPIPRTGADAVADLHALLTAAGVPGPYVLVGHSIGGHIARLYAHTYPDEVAGLVLVDASHEEQDVQLEALVGPELWAQVPQNLAIEGLDVEAAHAEVRDARAAAPLQPMPLVVVSAGQPEDAARYPPGWPMAAYQELVREQQADLAGLVPNGRHVVAERSGHYVHQSEPELVVEAIRHVVEAVRDPSTWAPPGAATPTP